MSRPIADLFARQLRTSTGKADSRAKLIGAVRAAAKRLRLGDDDRRAIQEEATGKASLAEMSLGEIGKVLDRLNRDRPAPAGNRAHVGKVRALWWTLYWLGEIAEPNDQALDAFVKRQTGIAALRFLDHRRAPAVIEALKAMAARAGVAWPKPIGDAAADRRAVLDAIWIKLRDARVVNGGHWSLWAAAAIEADPADLPQWSSQQLDAAIRALGKRWRRASAQRGTPE